VSERPMSEIGGSDANSITVRGLDLATELMGRISFGEMTFLLSAGRQPTQGEARLFDAVLVSLAEHGLTPSVLSARLTYTGAPESLQGAVAAGLLGAGSVFLGPVGDTAVFLAELVARAGGDEDALRRSVREAVATAVAEERRVPGLGHPIHRETDPRTPRLYEIAEECELLGPHMRALEIVSAEFAAATHRKLPINGAGAAGAALVDLGFDPKITRGFALVARAAGLVAHLAEEGRNPIGMRVWQQTENHSKRRE
jgi:citrate synthase